LKNQRSFSEEDIQKIADLTMNYLDESGLRYSRRGVRDRALKNARNRAIRELVGLWIERPYNKELYGNLKSRVCSHLSGRKNCRGHISPKKSKSVQKSNSISIENCGCPKTRESFLRQEREKQELATEEGELFTASAVESVNPNKRKNRRKRKSRKPAS
jgi:hypothetical protein